MFVNILGVSEAGEPKKDEDHGAYSETCLIVIDGATGLSDVKVTESATDAQWFAEQMSVQLYEHLAESEEPTEAAVQHTQERVRDQYIELFKKALPGEDYNSYSASDLPSATMALFRIAGESLEFLSLGDCRGAIKSKSGDTVFLGESSLRQLDAVAIESMVAIAKDKGISVLEARPYIQDLLIKHRNMLNTPQGYSALSVVKSDYPEPCFQRFPLSSVESVALFTDGYFEIVDPFALVKNASDLMLLIRKEGLRKPLERLRQEQERDSSLNAFPRFKIKDDASALYADIDKTRARREVPQVQPAYAYEPSQY